MHGEFRHPLAQAPKRHQRKVVRIEMVAQVEMVGETGAGELALLPVAALALALQEPLHAAHQVLTDPVLAGDQPDHRPRGLRRRAGAASVPGRVLVAQTALAPSAVLALLGLEPVDRTFDPRLPRIHADSTQA